MREKRKRNIASATKGLSAGEKLNRSRLLVESDLRWNWIGTEARHVSEITKEHCIRATGLSLSGSKRICRNKFLEKIRSTSPHQERALSSEDPGDVIVISDDDEDRTCDKRRCKDNPYCLNYLGQDRWEDEEKAEEMYLKVHLEDKDPTSSSRGKMPAGLKNLGATCYANAFLQVWFQDLAFRSGVYRCLPSPTNQQKFKDSPIFQLQVTFTALQEGRQSVFNPVKLVESLRLRTTEQQDAQEFSKLFMSHLDDEFKKQNQSELKSLLPDQFEGKMVNATVCDKCKARSERETTFLELEVNLEKNGVLEDRIASVLEPERLDDNNKYLCSVCESLQDATRYTEIRSLPPVLHISLLRFVYDLTTYERKKSKVSLKFPPYLNMKPFLQSSDPQEMLCDEMSDNSEEIYELRGVLLHKGPSAYHGHYEAQVYNQQAKKWYQFNDEVVTPLSSFHFAKPVRECDDDAIIVDDDADKDRPSKRQKRTTKSRRVEDSDEEEIIEIAPNGATAGDKTLTSKDAYMLIYARRDDSKLSNTWPLTPPPAALEIINSLNGAHEKECIEYAEKCESAKVEFAKMRELMKGIYSSWSISSTSEPSIIVSKSALENWLLWALTPAANRKEKGKKGDVSIGEKTTETENKISASDDEMDFPSKFDAANGLPSSFPMTIDSTNLLCPSSYDNHERQLNPLSDKEMKVMSMAARDKIRESGFSFIPEFTTGDICRNCIENEFCERLYCIEHPRLVCQFNDKCKTETENEGYWISKSWLKDWQLNKPRMHIPALPDPPPDNISVEETENFHSDVYCKHGNLTINLASRRRISLESVQLLKQLFESWNPPIWNTETCPTCDVDVHLSKESKLEQRKIAEDEKAQFSRIYENYIFGHLGVPANSVAAVVPADFIHRWRKWLIRPGEPLRPTTLDTQSMLCEHGNLNLDLADEKDFNNELAVLTLSEWDHLLNLYTGGKLVEVRCTIELDDSGNERRFIASTLPCCFECRKKKKLDFSSAIITIKRLKSNDPVPISSSPAESLLPADDNGKPMHSILNGKNGFPYVITNSVTANTNGTRQSRRLLEGRNFRAQQIQVQKHWTIKDVKIAIYKAFKISTISQQLFYHGSELDDSSKTIADLEIMEKDILYLKEFIEDAIVLDSDIEDEDAEKFAKKRAEGDAFKGTLLSCMNSSPPSEVIDRNKSSASPPPSQKSCRSCTLLNPSGAAQCEACESYF